MKSLDQDSFNEGKKKKRSINMDSRESWNNNWRLSSILATLDSFKMDSVGKNFLNLKLFQIHFKLLNY
jgi:hypothetical protein